MGLTVSTAEALFSAGVDVITSPAITSGTSARSTRSSSRPTERILRPLNYGTHDVPGRGWGHLPGARRHRARGINLQGRTYMQPIDNPFTEADRLFDEASEPMPPVRLVDFHCELTSEKNALGLYLDGRVSAVVGTHTHVATGDERILTKGTAYLTDLGMTGPIDSVIGFDPATVLPRFINALPTRFEVANGPVVFNAAPDRHRPGDRPRARHRAPAAPGRGLGASGSTHAGHRTGRPGGARRPAGASTSTCTRTRAARTACSSPGLLAAAAAAGIRTCLDHRPRHARRLPRAARPARASPEPRAHPRRRDQQRRRLAPTACREGELHVLGYGVDAGERRVRAICSRRQRGQRRRALPARAGPVARAGHARRRAVRVARVPRRRSARPADARAARSSRPGSRDSVDDAFRRILSSGRPGYVPRQGIGPRAAIRAITAAGGLAVARPLRRGPEPRSTCSRPEGHRRPRPRGLLPRLLGRDRRPRSRPTRAGLGCVPTGGSDYHGDRETYAEAHAATLGAARGRRPAAGAALAGTALRMTDSP